MINKRFIQESEEGQSDNNNEMYNLDVRESLDQGEKDGVGKSKIKRKSIRFIFLIFLVVLFFIVVITIKVTNLDLLNEYFKLPKNNEQGIVISNESKKCSANLDLLVYYACSEDEFTKYD